MTINALTTIATPILASTLLATTGLASPVSTVFADLAHCDPLSGPAQTDELGLTPPFPAACSIFADSLPTSLSACPASDVPGVANAIVRMTNLSGRSFYDVWYVGEFGTGFTNFDGTVNAMEAFKIDAVGGNRPLVSESITANGIFEPGESWAFIIDDYTNTGGMPPEAFVSLGVPSGGAISSGSIVANAVPGAGTLWLLGVCGTVGLRRRR